MTISAVTDTRGYDGTHVSSQTPVCRLTRSARHTVRQRQRDWAASGVPVEARAGAGNSTLVVTGYTIDDGVGGADYRSRQ